MACKYVQLKLGKNLCRQRIAVYNDFEEIKYETITNLGNIILKISNACGDKILINKDISKEEFEEKMKEFKKAFEGNHGLKESQFFHLYSKKRIIAEKLFYPRKDMYEFKFFLVNNKIKFLYVKAIVNGRMKNTFYDPNFKLLSKTKNYLNINKIFNKNILNELKSCAIKLSEDFPNFIRVDLYLYHNEIYFSELTFASHTGLPFLRNENFIIDSVRNFTRFDDVY